MSTENEKNKQLILLVDDAAMNRAILADMLGADYNIIEAGTGAEAVAILQSRFAEISLVLLDVVMPEMDGLEVLAVMNRKGWIKDTPVVMVSAETSSSVIERAYTLGAIDFISRPFDSSIVRRRVLNTLMLYAKQKALIGLVQDQIYEREKSVSMMVQILSQIVEFRNGESGLHVLHVSTMTEMLLQHIIRKTDKYNLTQQDISLIGTASSLHDIGKIAIPEEILNKPGKLTDEEYELMKQHAPIGANMLKELPMFGSDKLLEYSHEICRWHHERFDGRGYPDGLKGDEIPIAAQVVALADVYDALTSERVYKDAIPHDEAIQMILNGECGTFDPFLLECLQDIQDEIHHQLKITSASDYMRHEAERTAELVATPEGLEPSNRTLDLLEYERTKFNFFAKMSREVQFEFTVDPPLAIIADWGTPKLGLPELIHDPLEDEQLISMFGREQLDGIVSALHSTTPDNPIIECDCTAFVNNEAHWYRLAARALWHETPEGMVYDGAIGKLIDIHEQRKRLSDLEHKATRDSLTGLFNHGYARNVISERMREMPENTFILMVLDMDRFKDVNDTRGHLFGDGILQFLADRMRGAVRESDVLARVGGDEFLICMEADAELDPKPLIDRVYNNLLGTYEDWEVSISMGAAVTKAEDTTYDELFKNADQLLYEMKRGGRGGYIMKVFSAGKGSNS